MAPQIIILSLWAVALLLAAHMHGKAKKQDTYSFWATLIHIAITASILYWGGFFDKLLN